MPENKNIVDKNKLFENFVVIGPNQNNIVNLSLEKDNVLIMEPTIIFDFNDINEMTQNKYLSLI